MSPTPVLATQLNGNYKKSKWEAEKVALRYAKEGLPVVVVNPSTPIGPGKPQTHAHWPNHRGFANGRIPRVHHHTGLNFIHVNDVTAGQILASDQGKVG